MSALVITTNWGAEQSELQSPINALREAGIAVVVASEKAEPVKTLVFDQDLGAVIEADTTFDQVSPDDFDVLVVPGGTLNADALRRNEHALALAKGFAAAGKTIAALCHAPWLIVEAGLADGKRLTSWESVQTDIRNAGGEWVDEALVRDEGAGWTLLTSRSPYDLEQFNAAIIEAAR